MLTSFKLFVKQEFLYMRQELQQQASSKILGLTLSNPIFLPPAYSPALIYFGLERGWWITCPYYMRKRVRQAPTAEQENKRNKKNVSDIFRHWSGTGKS
jgi:hypothetical protein